MDSTNLFKQMSFWRSLIVGLLNEIPNDDGYKTPQGFNNNILWNAGHVLVTYEEAFHNFNGASKQLDDKFYSYFSTGTSPNDWNHDDLPTITEVTNLLDQQVKDFQKNWQERLNEPLVKPLEFEKTVEELLFFLISHECYHLGVMTSMKKVI
ncbi:DinB family protein [Piscibacillus salipiscarius]|uniref:DinB family protein n=1 Tax=Piscibacillus salipiscarius TaxID=299480 RepID=A0ABW5QEN3_9BACI|nr:DinB family protein [Piscibacillus salipiscarius]